MKFFLKSLCGKYSWRRLDAWSQKHETFHTPTIPPLSSATAPLPPMVGPPRPVSPCHPLANNKLIIKSTIVKGTIRRSFCVCVLTHVIQFQVGGSAVGEVVAKRVDLTWRHLVRNLIIRVIQNVIQGQVERDEEVRPVRFNVRKPNWSYCTGQFEWMAFICC